MDYASTPGFQFALDTGLDSVKRKMAASGMLHSGGTLQELLKYGTGLAMQGYDKYADRLQQQRQGDQQYGLGMYRAGNDYDLGKGGLANQAQGQWYDYDLGKERNAIAGSDSQNRYNIDWFNANTNRGNAESNDYWKGTNSMLDYLRMGTGGR
jgi:hypothetical protein